MKQKSTIHSLLLVFSILIIFLFLWTAGAVGDTENNVKNTRSLIKDTDKTIEVIDNPNESIIDNNSTSVDMFDINEIIEINDTIDNNTLKDTNITTDSADSLIDDANIAVDDTDIAVDDTDIAVDDTNIAVDDANIAVDDANIAVDDANIAVDDTDSIAGIDNSIDDDNTTDVTDSSIDDINIAVDDTDSIAGINNSYDDNNTTNITDSLIDDANVSVDETNNFNDTVISGDDTFISGDETVTPGNEIVTPGDETVTPEDGTVTPEDETITPGDETVDPGEDVGNSDDTKPLELTVDEPIVDFVFTRPVLFNFSASDKLDDNLAYSLYINGTERSKGIITEGEWKQVEINLEDGYYTWEIKIEDGLGNTDSSGPTELNVDTNAPIVTLISPDDFVVNTGGPLNFSFTADNELDDLYKDQNLTYEVDIDGEPLEGTGSGTMRPGECIQTQDITDLSDGAHDWSVYIEDKAGNNVTSDARTFYVDKKGLRVSLVSPNNKSVVNPRFKFRVSGGTGLPFSYILLVNGEEVKRTTCDGSENKTLEVGDEAANDYSVEASVPDGKDKTWTVNITDIAGNIYIPDPYRFSLDTTDPGRVANLSVRDAPGETQWSYTRDSPRLYVSWDASAGEDLASTPYDVFISDFEPHSIESMQKVKSTSETSLRIEKYGKEPLEYGKDYWVAVIARDKLGNYNKCFIAICGPVRAYEDMNITLNQGWNMKSVPKRLLESTSSPESVFGKSSTILYWNGKSWEAPKTIEPCKGYWIYSPEIFENNVKFESMPSDEASADLAESLNLAPGWQMIGSTSMQPIAWSTTLASLENSNAGYKFSNLITYSSSEGWNGVIPGLGLASMSGRNESGIFNKNFTNNTDPRPVGMLKNEGMMVPGQGYWVYITKEGTYNPSEPGGTDKDVLIDDSMTDNETIDDGSIDNVTSEGGTAEEVGFNEEATDDNVTDGGSAEDVGFSEVTTDEVTTDEVTTDGGTAQDVGFNEEATDDGTADDGNNDIGSADDVPVTD